VSGIQVGDGQPIDLGYHLPSLVLFTTVYFLLNSGLNSIVVSLHQRVGVWRIWRQHFGWVLLNYFGATSVAALLVHNSRDFNLFTLAVVVPLIAISYLTFKTSMARVEDANRHLQELNRLYLSTIETLAMAVDAKDQITHGHIRRVQACAVGLARVLGVTDDRTLKAIEAAALLHDMGKLAIPEHILNKPGKLSPAEFEKMKKHATIGAEILSAIEFPYPVVPIVRHHHEQWNGNGYPDGIVGADIPIGARILSVVDCYDALTSDRPYRRALTPEQAIQMLLDQSGTAFDPLVVETFARVYRDIVPAELDYGPNKRTLQEIAAVSRVEPHSPSAEGDARAGGADTDPHLLPIYESLHTFSAQTVLAEAADDLARRLRRATPATLFGLYVYDVEAGDLALSHAAGDGAEALLGLRIAVGERLSGWVAANRRTVCNSDAALDLGDLPLAMKVALSSCLSVPLVVGDTLVGVLSLYAEPLQAFSERDRRLVEQAARPLAHLVRGALELEKVQHATVAGALATLPRAEDAVTELDPSGEPRVGPLAAVSLQVHALDEIPDATTARAIPDLLLARAASLLRRDLRIADLLYRDGENGLMAVLPYADASAAATIAARAHDSLLGAMRSLDAEAASRVHILTGIGISPVDGLEVDDVMQAARRRALNPDAGERGNPAGAPAHPGGTSEASRMPWRRAS